MRRTLFSNDSTPLRARVARRWAPRARASMRARLPLIRPSPRGCAVATGPADDDEIAGVQPGEGAAAETDGKEFVKEALDRLREEVKMIEATDWMFERSKATR